MSITKPPIPTVTTDMPKDGSHKQLDSHVQAPTPVYGEPKGPRPATMFRHEPSSPMPPDRERDGFIGGRDEVGLGDIVGSGPEQWERKQSSPPEKEEDEPPTR